MCRHCSAAIATEPHAAISQLILGKPHPDDTDAVHETGIDHFDSTITGLTGMAIPLRQRRPRLRVHRILPGMCPYLACEQVVHSPLMWLVWFDPYLDPCDCPRGLHGNPPASAVEAKWLRFVRRVRSTKQRDFQHPRYHRMMRLRYRPTKNDVPDGNADAQRCQQPAQGSDPRENRMHS